MDIASLLGIIGAIGFILYAMISGGGVGPFLDVPSLAIVFGGTFFCVMYTCPLPTFLGSFGVMAKAFFPPVKPQDELVTKMVELAGIARKDGMMALEGQDVPDKFFSKGLQMLVDGADEAKLTTQLNQEIKAMKARHENNQNVVKAWIDIAPAMGMIGTLVGLVLMLGNMADPKAIGPAPPPEIIAYKINPIAPIIPKREAISIGFPLCSLYFLTCSVVVCNYNTKKSSRSEN